MSARLFSFLFIISLGLARAESEWMHAQSPHFEVYSSSSKGETELYVRELERMREVSEIIFHLKIPSEARTLVIICSSERDMKPFLREFKGERVENSGLCVGPSNYPALILSDAFRTKDTKSTLYHEYMHLLLEQSWGETPLWFNEGLAQVMGALQIKETEFVLGKLDNKIAPYLARDRLIPLLTLFDVQADSKYYLEDPERSVFYAQSWVFVHMCMFGRDHDFGAKLQSFAQASLHAANKRALFEKSYGMPIEKVEKIFRAYVSSGSSYMTITVKMSPQPEGLVSFIPCSAKEAKAASDLVLARVHNWSEDSGKRNALADELIALDGLTNPFLKEVGALELGEMGDAESSKRLGEEAIACGSTHPRVWSQKIDRRLAMYGYGTDFVLPDEVSKELRAQVDCALAVCGNDPELVRQLAWVETYSRLARKAQLTFLENQYPTMRNPQMVRLLLAIMRWRYQDPKTALALINGLEFEHQEMRSLLGLLRQKLEDGETFFRPKKLVIPESEAATN